MSDKEILNADYPGPKYPRGPAPDYAPLPDEAPASVKLQPVLNIGVFLTVRAITEP